MTKKTFIIAGVVVIAVVVAGLTLPKILGGHKEELVAEVPPAVSVEKPHVRSIRLSSELIGTIEPDSIVYVTPLGSGEVTSVNVKTGDMVTQDQELCIIDTKQLESSKISVDTARISYQKAKNDYDRNSVLYAAGDIATADYQALADQLEVSRLQYKNAKIAYDIAKESSHITAPIAGRVESFDIKVHDMISPQTTICVISGQGGKSVTFYVSERIVKGLKAGDDITVEKSGTEHTATISEVSSMIDDESGLFKVKASIPEGEVLATGTSVKLNVISQKADQVLTVPVDSVYYEGGNAFIYTYDNGTLHKIPVTIGLEDDQYAEVKEGINADDQVVSTWTSELFDGSKVTLVDKKETETSKAQEQTADGEAETSASAQ